MLQYKDYLNRVIEYYSEESEDSFNEITKLFPKVYEIDWNNYYPDGDDLINYILEFLIGSVDSPAYVEESDEYHKSVILSYVCSLEELEDLKNVFESNGWTIDNYEDIKEEIEEEEKENKVLEARENLIQKIKDTATLDQLQKFANEL